jgi:ribosome-associated heat shock protein Hsp15
MCFLHFLMNTQSGFCVLELAAYFCNEAKPNVFEPLANACFCLLKCTLFKKNNMEKTRVDKWLWSVRIFKTRTLATDACKAGKVKVGNAPVKPSYLLQTGEQVQVKKEGFNLLYKVVEVIEKRVGAPQAQLCYENLTPESELNKYKEWYIGKAVGEQRDRGVGRPTKRERRDIDRFKDIDGWSEEED